MLILVGIVEKPNCKKLGWSIGWARKTKKLYCRMLLYFNEILMSSWVQDSLRTVLYSKWQSVLKADQLLHLKRPIWKPKETKLLETCFLCTWKFFCVFVCLFRILKSLFILHMPSNWSCSSRVKLDQEFRAFPLSSSENEETSTSHCPLFFYYKKESPDNQVLNDHAKTHVIRRMLHSCITPKALMTGNRLGWERSTNYNSNYNFPGLPCSICCNCLAQGCLVI